MISKCFAAAVSPEGLCVGGQESRHPLRESLHRSRVVSVEPVALSGFPCAQTRTDKFADEGEQDGDFGRHARRLAIPAGMSTDSRI
jgi:hypothetical protein